MNPAEHEGHCVCGKRSLFVKVGGKWFCRECVTRALVAYFNLEAFE